MRSDGFNAARRGARGAGYTPRSQGFDYGRLRGPSGPLEGIDATLRPTVEQDFAGNLMAAIRRGFAGRALVGLRDAAKILNMNEKTLRRHIAEGNVSFVKTGTGEERMRREFAPEDLLNFYASRRDDQVPARRVFPRDCATGTTGSFAAAVPRPKKRNLATEGEQG